MTWQSAHQRLADSVAVDRPRYQSFPPLAVAGLWQVIGYYGWLSVQETGATESEALERAQQKDGTVDCTN